MLNLAPVHKLDGHMTMQAAFDIVRGVKGRQEGQHFFPDLILRRIATATSVLLLVSVLSSLMVGNTS